MPVKTKTAKQTVQTVKTTPKGPRISQDVLWVMIENQIDKTIESAKTKYEKARDTMIDAMKVNPADAIGWQAGRVVDAQTNYWFLAGWQEKLSETVATHDAAALVKLVADIQQYALREMFSKSRGGCSTSPFSNAVEGYEREAYATMADDSRWTSLSTIVNLVNDLSKELVDAPATAADAWNELSNDEKSAWLAWKTDNNQAYSKIEVEWMTEWVVA